MAKKVKTVKPDVPIRMAVSMPAEEKPVPKMVSRDKVWRYLKQALKPLNEDISIEKLHHMIDGLKLD